MNQITEMFEKGSDFIGSSITNNKILCAKCGHTIDGMGWKSSGSLMNVNKSYYHCTGCGETEVIKNVSNDEWKEMVDLEDYNYKIKELRDKLEDKTAKIVKKRKGKVKYCDICKRKIEAGKEAISLQYVSLRGRHFSIYVCKGHENNSLIFN